MLYFVELRYFGYMLKINLVLFILDQEILEFILLLLVQLTKLIQVPILQVVKPQIPIHPYIK